MFEQLLETLEVIRVLARRQSNPLSTTDKGLPFTVVADAQAHGPLATLYFINAVSVLDDALKLVIKTYVKTTEIKKLNSLSKRIEFLEKRNTLSNPKYLRDLKKMRNDFAHEVGRYATWQDLWAVLDNVRDEIQYLQR